MKRHDTVFGVAREGLPVIALMAAACGLAASGAWWIAGDLVGLAATGASAVILLWAVWFFRDPDRSSDADASSVICGADGVVCFVGPGVPPTETELHDSSASGMTRVSVFMNIFNVHVNRAPVDGRVERIAYKPGKFFNASLDKASEHNERLSMVLRRNDGSIVVVVQIAGLIARRIVCRVKEGELLARGARFGLIRFGSRVDHYLPAGARATVRVGDRVSAGVSTLGVFERGTSQRGEP